MRIILSPEEYRALEAALLRWGAETQIGMAVEEVGEFLSAINKYRRGRVPAGAVVEEVADVILMMLQMSILFGPGHLFLESNINDKLQRLMALIDQEEAAIFKVKGVKIT